MESKHDCSSDLDAKSGGGAKAGAERGAKDAGAKHLPLTPSKQSLASFAADSKDVGDEPALSALEEKLRRVELEEEQDVEDEFAALMNKSKREGEQGEARIASDPRARKAALGFSIQSMNMRDATSGALVWQSSRFSADMFEREMEERIPKSILQCRAVSREIVFSSKESLTNFRLVQRVFFQGQCIEEWFFTFGFVMPGSTNSWQQIIEAAPPDQMLPAEHLSGNITFETSFYDEGQFLCKNLFRIYYV